jgi:hypothetical protein
MYVYVCISILTYLMHWKVQIQVFCLKGLNLIAMFALTIDAHRPSPIGTFKYVLLLENLNLNPLMHEVS